MHWNGAMGDWHVKWITHITPLRMRCHPKLMPPYSTLKTLSLLRHTLRRLIWLSWHHQVHVSGKGICFIWRRVFLLTPFSEQSKFTWLDVKQNQMSWSILPAVQNACKECSVYMYSSLLPSYFDTKKSTPSKPLRNFLAQKLGVGVKVELYCLPFRLSEKVSPIHQATTTYLCVWTLGLYIFHRTFYFYLANKWVQHCIMCSCTSTYK